jgi:cell division topological specificity factor
VSILTKLFRYRPQGSDTRSSKNVAKERLKLALTYDRSGLARGAIEQLGDEIIRLIAKHLDINEEDVQINFDRTAESDKLTASIPLHIVQRPRIPVAPAPAAQKSPSTKKSHSKRRRRPRHAH